MDAPKADPHGPWPDPDSPDRSASGPPVVIGCDPGVSGALAALTLDGDFVAAVRVPATRGRRSELDVPGIVAFVRGLRRTRRVALAAIERVSAMPGQGVASSFTFGMHFGVLRGCLSALGLPVELVLPQAWQRAVLAGTSKDKQATIAYCKRRWPTADLRGSTAASAEDHSGVCDALAIAEYARRLVCPAPAEDNAPPRVRKRK